jgi:hypothetical protein
VKSARAAIATRRGHRVNDGDRAMSSTKQNSAVEAVVNDVLADLYAKSGCDKVGLARESFAAILCEVGAKHATAATSGSEIRTFLLTLRVDELALARATAKSFISPPSASRAKTPPPANWPTLSTPIFMAPTPARENGSPNSLPIPAAGRSRVGCVPFCPRNMSIATAVRSDW